MSHGEFIPLGDERLAQSQSSGFVRVTRPGMVDEDVIEPAQPVSPAEDNDLSSRIRQILQPHVQGTTLDQALAEIQTAVDAAPARMALPEIKLTPGPATNPDAEGETPPPTIELERDNNTVSRVKVHCGCGQTIALDCMY
mgnify:CR=1 FL=1